MKTFIGNVLDEAIRQSSSSGGIFVPLAEQILNQNGCVIGAAMCGSEVRHIVVESKQDLPRLQGSKYLQSHMDDIYLQTKQLLNSNRLVLFSGTPCQIAALKSFLAKDYEKLFTVDVLCHGVPSEKVWKLYWESQSKQLGTISKISFRSKRLNGWRNFSMQLQGQTRTYEKSLLDDAFLQMFMKNVDLRPSCYHCRLKDEHRSDLTLGDCWSIQRIRPQIDDNKGTSVILVHSEKGERLLQAIAPQCRLYEADFESVLPKKSESRSPVAPHPKRNEFFRKLNQGASIRELQKMVADPFFVRLRRTLYRIKHKLQ